MTTDDLQSEFNRLTKQWQTQTGYQSSLSVITSHPSYQRIISLGEDVVPLILNELSDRPDHWFTALQSITGDNPVSPAEAGNLKLMSKAWLRWGHANHILVAG